MKDFTDKECCLTCNGFCFWEGDYCCSKEMCIHQFGYNDGIWFTKDIDNTMETPQTCKDYEYAHHETYPIEDNPYIEEYKKYKAWENLKEQYYKQIK